MDEDGVQIASWHAQDPGSACALPALVTEFAQHNGLPHALFESFDHSVREAMDGTAGGRAAGPGSIHIDAATDGVWISVNVMWESSSGLSGTRTLMEFPMAASSGSEITCMHRQC